ncbi:MAG TPA: undecaprenyldiphospho-muramoylpentapeptide beta-N-acetylglucosaminyltransferase [Clostridiales bacterium]|nr:undecaprenyldiphospho-muramoylpentapeptide beta-N-acetylglucosaminyltransferase [Clostridiales bacterium]
MHILFAGGGTAGHINPALAAAGYIRARHPEAKISFIGTQNGLEARLVPEAGYDFYTIDVAGFQRKINFTNIKRNISALGKVFKASFDAKKMLFALKPDVVVGTGGYVSGPVLRQAAKLGIKTAIHEQNAFPGITTKMLAPMVDKVMLAMPDAQKHLKLKSEPIITGNPVRESLLNMSREQARRKLGMDSRPFILSFGGSLGARPINQAVADLIKWHFKTGKYYHYHATGKTGYEPTMQLLKDNGVEVEGLSNIRITEYINDMDVLMAAADLVICRCGAITLSELQVQGKPSILIPSPYVAENHQFHNAMTMKRINAAEVIEEKDLTGYRLIRTVALLLSDKARLLQMGQNAKKLAVFDANQRIYNVIMQLCEQA